MKKLLVIALPSIVLLLCSSAFSQRASFSESYADKLVTERIDGETYYEVYPTGRFTTRGSFKFPEPIDLSLIDENTSFSMELGGWSYGGVFGDDPKFSTGKKSVTIKLDSGAVVKIAFTAKAASWSVTARTGSDLNNEYESSPAAGDYAGSDESYSIKKSDGATVSCTVGLGDEYFLSGELPLTGRVRATIKKVGSGDFVEEIPLSSVSLSATGILE